MGRYRDAHNDIGGSAFDNDRHAAFWRGLIEAALENWDGSRKALAMAEPVHSPLRARMAGARAAGSGRKPRLPPTRSRWPMPRLQSPAARSSAGYRASGAAGPRAPLRNRRPLSRCADAFRRAGRIRGNERIAARALFDDTQAGLADGAITRDQAIAALEQSALPLARRRARAAKRCANWARSTSKRSAGARDSNRCAIASQNFPNEELARQAQDDMRATFVNLFLKGKADAMPPIRRSACSTISST